MAVAFRDRLLPAPRDGGFAMEDYWVWCGSVIRDDSGRYQMFASRWPHDLAFSPHWLTNSEIVRASSDTPEGPFAFEEVVLPARGAGFWDGLMTHNPTIHRRHGRYLLFYTGTTYSGAVPTPGSPCTTEQRLEARANQRIGVAVADRITGPWTRLDQPILPPRPGRWDALITTNPAPCVAPDGRILLIYKSVAHQGDLLRLGVAGSERGVHHFQRLAEEPIFTFDATGDHVEDAFVWHNGSGFELIMKDMRGGICGEPGGGIHAVSDDGITWQISDPPQAYSRTVVWDDGTTTKQGHLERPQLLLQDGVPTHLYAATADGPGGFNHATRSWTMVIPLRTP